MVHIILYIFILSSFIPDSSEEDDGEQQQKQCSIWSRFANGVRAEEGRHDNAKKPKDSKHFAGPVCPPRYSDDTFI